MTICRSSWSALLVVGAFVAPAALSAQEPAPPVPTEGRTHVVKTGDTLWDLAHFYFGDAFLWPEIYRVNTDVVEDPHWIYPGEVLQIPEGIGRQVVQEPAEPPGPTVLQPPTRHAEGPTGPNGLQIMGPPAVRRGEFYAAPYVDRDGGPDGSGEVVASSEIYGIATDTRRDFYQFKEKIYARPPRGTTPAQGDKYLVYKLGPSLRGMGQVVVPTGIVEVEQPGRDGEAMTIRIVQQFDMIRPEQRLIALAEFPALGDARPAPTEVGPKSKVVWISQEPILPSLQRFLVLDITSKDGVKLGDVFMVHRPTATMQRGDKLPIQDIAEARVVRVTPQGTTVIVTAQEMPAIKPGGVAQVTARMP